MKDLYDLIQFSRTNPKAWSEGYVLATVVHTAGHAYRRAGARLLLKNGRKVLGAISGGCLEEGIAEDAGRLSSNGRAKRVDYDSRSASDLIWGTATGCGGLVSVLLHRWESRLANVCEWIDERLSARRPVLLATIINKDDQQLGGQIAIDTSGEIFSQIDSVPIQAAVMSRTAELLSESNERPNRYQSRTCVAGRAELLLEYIPPPTSLVIIGAGDDAKPVVEGAKRLGWTVTVIDHRPAYADRERFPLADQVLLTQPDSYLDLLHADPWTVTIVMTHNWRQDAAAIAALAQFDLPYVGIIGNTARTENILATLAARNRSRANLRTSFSYPAGLDIGAHTPEEIALSVIAEVQAVLSGRQGASLKDQNRPGSKSVDARLLAIVGADRR
jgi:xanthine dehydrogenase accessory factor